MDEETRDQNRLRLRVIDGIPPSLSDREARTISREMSALRVPISATRLQQLWSQEAIPTASESTALQTWRQYCVRDAQRIRDQNDRLQKVLWKAFAANVILWAGVAALYLFMHFPQMAESVVGTSIR